MCVLRRDGKYVKYLMNVKVNANVTMSECERVRGVVLHVVQPISFGRTCWCVVNGLAALILGGGSPLHTPSTTLHVPHNNGPSQHIALAVNDV